MSQYERNFPRAITIEKPITTTAPELDPLLSSSMPKFKSRSSHHGRTVRSTGSNQKKISSSSLTKEQITACRRK